MAQVTFAPLRRTTLRDQSSQSPSLRFRPRLRRGSFVLTLILGSLQMGHPWPSAAQSASMPIAPPNQRQDSAFTHVAIGGVRTIAQKSTAVRCLTGSPDDLCITMSARVGMHPGTLRARSPMCRTGPGFHKTHTNKNAPGLSTGGVFVQRGLSIKPWLSWQRGYARLRPGSSCEDGST